MGSDGERILRGIRPRNVARLLEELGELGRGDSSATRPEVTLVLAGNARVRGRVRDLAREEGSAVVLLHLSGFDAGTGWDVAHVPLEAVVSVVIHDLVALSMPQGMPGPRASSPAMPTQPRASPPATTPSRDDVRRTMAALEAQLSTQVGAVIGFDAGTRPPDDELEPISHAAMQVAQVLDRVAQDEMGRKSLQAQVRTVRLLVGNEPAVSFADGTLQVVTVVAPDKRLTGAALARSIQSLL